MKHANHLEIKVIAVLMESKPDPNWLFYRISGLKNGGPSTGQARGQAFPGNAHEAALGRVSTRRLLRPRLHREWLR